MQAKLRAILENDYPYFSPEKQAWFDRLLKQVEQGKDPDAIRYGLEHFLPGQPCLFLVTGSKHGR